MAGNERIQGFKKGYAYRIAVIANDRDQMLENFVLYIFMKCQKSYSSRKRVCSRLYTLLIISFNIKKHLNVVEFFTMPCKKQDEDVPNLTVCFQICLVI